ncbi:TetR/AcrR family transcriptional regulator [Saccharopolyspora sp. CA-218241]|uniref:TetR/AcrR family transcriptional regulator n=1 Tax=Saccharopolyspora sp. CA-218241 TaxID=3240027 RepID=UPI003D95F4AD
MTAPRAADRRAQRSRAALETALLDLIAERGLNRISVSDLTGRAEVHRTTFYEHYTDVHDLAAAACTQMFDELIAAAAALTTNAAPGDDLARRALTEVFAHVAEHRALYQALLSADGSAKVINHLLDRMTRSVREHHGVPGGIRGAPPAFLAGALLGTITDWLRHGCPGTPDQLGAAVWPHLAAAAEPRPD